MSTTSRLAASFIVHGSNAKPIGAVILGANGRHAAWNRAGKVGEFDSRDEAIAAVRKAHFSKQREERNK